MVSFSGATAASVPQLENFISLVGAVASAALAIIFPPLFHILTFKDKGLKKIWFLKNVFIMTVGVLGFVFGTYTSVVAIIKGFHNSPHISNSTVVPTTLSPNVTTHPTTFQSVRLF